MRRMMDYAIVFTANAAAISLSIIWQLTDIMLLMYGVCGLVVLLSELGRRY